MSKKQFKGTREDAADREAKQVAYNLRAALKGTKSDAKRQPHEVLFAQYNEAKAAGNNLRMRRIENTVIAENTLLIHRLIAKRCKALVGPVSCDGDDLFQAGCMGMLHAWRTWDPSKGKLSTHAGWQIWHHIQELLARSQPIYRPRDAGRPKWVHKLYAETHTRHGREPTVEEIQAAAPVGKKGRKITLELINEWRNAPVVWSLDDSWTGPFNDAQWTGATGDTQEQSLHECIADERPSPEMSMEHAEMVEQIVEAMDQLTDREAIVIRELFLEGRSYKQIGEDLKLCDDMIRKERLGGLAKLREAIEE